MEFGLNNKVYYVSHPFGGDRENLKKCAEIITQLQEKYPQVTFVSPIHTFEFLYDIQPYDVGIRHCIDLLECCDVMIDCDPLLMSKGCNDERKWCTEHDKPIIKLKDVL